MSTDAGPPARESHVLPGLRDRLLLAFANVASYGVRARPALAASAPDGHRRLAAELRVAHPAALGSYVFWTRPDDAAFGPDGELAGVVRLH